MIHRRLFLGAASAVLGLLTGKALALPGESAPIKMRSGVTKLTDWMKEQKAKRDAGPACQLYGTQKRGINGLCWDKLPPIYGDGEHDDEPGLSAALADRGSVDLPDYRIYRLHKPLSGNGGISISDPGKSSTGTHIEPELSAPLKPGHARFFYVDQVDWGGREIVTLDLPII